MGQYFVIVNLTKKEFIHPHKLASGLKFWEILASQTAPRALAFLLRQSNEGGGGDIPESNEENSKLFCGRWRADRIAIIGDYDDSGVYERCTDLEGMKHHNKWALEEQKDPSMVIDKKELFKDITDKMLPEFNKFIDIPEYQVNLKSEGWRNNNEETKGKPRASPDMVLTGRGMIKEPRI